MCQIVLLPWYIISPFNGGFFFSFVNNNGKSNYMKIRKDMSL